MTATQASHSLVDAPRASFDLISESWLPIVDMDGTSREIGLADLVLDAHQIRRIVGETPPMTAALYRLVLAFLHRAYGPRDESAWEELWTACQLPSAPLEKYLREHAHRFDLFHPEHPFLQCPQLSSCTPATPAKLVPYRAVGNNVTLFDHTVVGDRTLLTPAEAARWLVTAQAYDPGGMKTPYLKEKSSERALCNFLGVVLVEGSTLKETLLLNAPVYHPAWQKPPMTTEADRPCWENPKPASPLPDKRTAHGWTDLLTWPSRRILLTTSQQGGSTVVDGVVLTPGTRLDVKLPDEEMMAAFRQPTTAKGKPKEGAPLLPVRLHPIRGIWRHSVELLLVDLRAEGRTRQRPRTLDHISELVDGGHIPDDAVYTLRVFGQQLDRNNSVVEAVMEEEVPAPVALLRARNRTLGSLIGCAITLADEVGAALRAMERDYRKDLRAEPSSELDLAYWPHLSRPFGAFLCALAEAHGAGTSETAANEAWARAVAATARKAADRWAEGSPRQGRDLIIAGKHHAYFLGRLDKQRRLFQAETAAYITPEGAE